MPVIRGSEAYSVPFVETEEQEIVQPERIRTTPTHRSSKTLRLRSSSKSSQRSGLLHRLSAMDPRQLRVITISALSVALISGFAVSNISNESRKYELASQISDCEAELKELQDDYAGLMVKYDERMTDTAIQEYAETELGMQKRENYQIHWITVGETNDFENDDTQKKSWFDWLASYFD